MSTPLDFVEFFLEMESVGSTPTSIFSSDKTSILQSIILSNQVGQPIKVYVYILETFEGGSKKYFYKNGITIPGLESLDILTNTILNIPIGCSIWAYSDFSSHLFNCFISGQILNETEEP